jgi:putative tributyrin esterase
MFFTIEFSDPRFEKEHLRNITVKTKNLQGRGDITVFIPPNVPENQPIPLVILLHGVYGSHWAWTQKAGVHNTALRLIEEGKIAPMILAMPSDGLWHDGSGYLAHQTQNFEKWIVEDVPQAVKECTPLFSKKSPIFIAGLSMGGYGALRLGAKYPNVFKAFSGLSSVTTFQEMGQFMENQDLSILAEKVEQPEDVLSIILAHKSTLNSFRFDCGSEDILIEGNRTLHHALSENNIAHIYEEFIGKHEWIYWEKYIINTLIFFQNNL